jgi:2-polyprenyl-6-methoxyphenol hydroxylase-like FAD-dependent oxidoreductase
MPDQPYRQPLMLPQHLTEAILRERLLELGHAPRYAHALSSFTQDEDSVTAQVDTPDGALTICAQYLVGADGSRSFVRKALDIGFHGEAIIAQRTGRSDIRIHAVHWASYYAMSCRLAERYRVGRIFLAGDAARQHGDLRRGPETQQLDICGRPMDSALGRSR